MLFGKYINKYYLKYGPLILIGIIALLAIDYMQLRIPVFYRMIVNGINTGFADAEEATIVFDMPFVLENILIPFLIVIAIILAGRFLWRVCFLGAGMSIEADLRYKMFEHSLTLSREYYHTNKVGNLMSLYTNDIEVIQDSFSFGTLMLTDALFQGTLAIHHMFKMNMSLTFLILIPILIFLVIGIVVGRYMEKKWEIREEAYSSLSDYAQESFSGISVVKAFVKESKELLGFVWLNKKNSEANVSFIKASALLNVLVGLFIESIIAIIIGYGGNLVHSHVFNAGELVEFLGYFTSIIWPVMAVSELIDMVSRGRASLKRITEHLDEEPTVKDLEGSVDIEKIDGDIEFKNLTFRYPGMDFDMLRDVSLKINAGDNIGIIGSTGSGKTTIVDLLLRTYNVERGTIFIDGRDINDISIKSLRNFCSYVPQDNFLFGNTISENVAFSLPTGSKNMEGRIIDAAKGSHVHEDIMDFPKKYDTVLGERGITVSGGQKQRISIARALVKDASILILDDSVSAVDTETENHILNYLRENRKGRTTILIAHRISSVEKMDKIIYMDEGKILGYGTSDELYETCPAFRHEAELQRIEDEGGEFNA